METNALIIDAPKTECKTRTRQRGVFEKTPGSGTWWNEALAGKKLPEKLRRRAVSFGEIADDAITYCEDPLQPSCR
jgi:hypothetical protein